MNIPQLILGTFATVLGLILLLVVIPAQHIPPIMSSVSPDFYPNIGVVMFLIGGIGLSLTALREDNVKSDFQKAFLTIRFCSLIGILFAITLILFQWTNFIAGGIALVFASMWLLGERRLSFLLSVSPLSPVLIWLFIDVLLGRNLP